jgi:hypothetical protein
VRHLSPVYLSGGERRYLVGLEFLNVDERAAVCIGSLIEEHRDRTTQGEA